MTPDDIELVHCNDGNGWHGDIQMADGSFLRPANGRMMLPAKFSHLLPRFRQQGWIPKAEQDEKLYYQELTRQHQEELRRFPMTTDDILRYAAQHGIELRVDADGDLAIRHFGSVDTVFRECLSHRKAEILAHIRQPFTKVK
jgi:hypothetical protein